MREDSFGFSETLKDDFVCTEDCFEDGAAVAIIHVKIGFFLPHMGLAAEEGVSCLGPAFC